MAQDHRSPGIDKVKIFVSVHIVHISAVGVVDETGAAADGAKSPDRTVDAAGNVLFGFGKSCLRFAVIHMRPPYLPSSHLATSRA